MMIYDPHLLEKYAELAILSCNTLFDENASCYLALGRALNLCMPGGAGMSDDEFYAAGGNLSLIHVDFMIGSADMDID
jgi:aminopeptidase